MPIANRRQCGERLVLPAFRSSHTTPAKAPIRCAPAQPRSRSPLSTITSGAMLSPDLPGLCASKDGRVGRQTPHAGRTAGLATADGRYLANYGHPDLIHYGQAAHNSQQPIQQHETIDMPAPDRDADDGGRAKKCRWGGCCCCWLILAILLIIVIGLVVFFAWKWKTDTIKTETIQPSMDPTTRPRPPTVIASNHSKHSAPSLTTVASVPTGNFRSAIAQHKQNLRTN